MTDSHDTPTTDTSEAETRSTRGPSRMIAVLAATVVAAGAIAYVAGRAENGTGPLPKLALSANAGSGTASLSRDSSARSSLALNVTYRYVVAGNLPDLASRAPVSRLVWPRVDAVTVGSWAKTLKLGGAEPIDGGRSRGWTVSGPNGMLNISENAGMSYFNYQSGGVPGAGGSSPGAEPPPGVRGGSDSGGATIPDPGTALGTVPPPDSPLGPITSDGQPSPVAEPTRPQDLPSIADARAKGEHLLRDLGVLDGAWEFEVRDGGSGGVSRSGVCAPDVACDPPPVQTFVTGRTVVAHRVIDGRRIDGLEWTVDLGDHSAVTSVSGTLAKVEAIGAYPLRPTSAAIDQLRRGVGSPYPIPLGAPEARSAIGAPDCGPAVDCIAPVPACPGACPPREVTVTITDVGLVSQLWFGSDATQLAAYLVPMYHFTGHDDTGAEWSANVLALEDGQLATPATSNPVPSPSPEEPPTPTPGIDEPPTVAPAPPAPSEVPSGPKVAVGDSVSMRFNLNFHCGVSEARFNAAWWDAVTPWAGSGGASPHIDDLDGRLTLERPDFARWANGSGVVLQFVPHVGAHVTLLCD